MDTPIFDALARESWPRISTGTYLWLVTCGIPRRDPMHVSLGIIGRDRARWLLGYSFAHVTPPASIVKGLSI